MMASLLKAVLIVALVALNAFFAAAEYSLLSVRRTQLEHLARRGNARARLVQTLIADIGLMISGTLLGMAVVSLLMGWLGENIISSTIENLLDRNFVGVASVIALHVVSMAIAFLFIAGLMIVLGELVPKAVAYDRADRVALMVARPMTLYLRLGRYPVLALNRMSNGVLRLLGYKRAAAHGPAHTPEEVKLIVGAIQKRGQLGKAQEQMIRSVFDFDRIRVREIMVPWPKVVRLAMPKDWLAALAAMAECGHSHVPVYEDTPEHIIGVLHLRELLPATLTNAGSQRLRGIRSLLREPVIVPESMPLSTAFEELRRSGAAIALVVDEFGTYTGMVSARDVLAQIVGEMREEGETVLPPVRKTGESQWVIDGSMSLRELEQQYDLHLPRDAGYETLAGFVISTLGMIPKGGETFIYEGRRFAVAEMDNRRVARVKVESPLSPPIESKDQLPAAGKT